MLFCALVCCFALFSTPISLIGMLMGIAMMYVGLLSLMGSFWYSYILFLVYVGGLLVLFIYVCLVSSNVSIKFNSNFFVTILLASSLISFSDSQSFNFLGFSERDGTSLVEVGQISIFLLLVVLLLMMLLVVVRISGLGMSILTNEV